MRFAAVLNGVPFEADRLDEVHGPMYAIERRLVIEHWLAQLELLRNECDVLMAGIDPATAAQRWDEWADVARGIGASVVDDGAHEFVIDLVNETLSVGTVHVLLSAREVQLRHALDTLGATLR
ncbi:MAG: hypothetical protein ACOYNI_08475 [Acidimicrobiia bacterium]